ncbi:MAG: translocation/assembly module TamB domain-containing protein, partial [Alloprevotella sp.]
DFTLDPEPVRLEDGKMQLTDFRLLSQQSRNPLLLNGTINVADLSNIGLNLNMRASDFELINTKRKMQSLIYGKVYADFVGTIKGTLNDMSVRGKLDVLDRTDMTYILKDSPLTVDDRLHDLVQFVSFEDSTVVIEESEVPSNFDLTLGISVSNAAHFHCDLSEDGNNYVDIEGGGDLTLRMTPQGEMRLTGRFTMENGEMKYSLPIIPLKTFKLAQGSYVEFTGDMMNPTLNIAATERVKATVTENDQPRSVAFDVGVSITQPLESMGLEFTIEAPEDLAMQNKLAGMTRAQRGKSAVAMLATGMFLDDESLTSGGSGFKAGNALTAFLQSEIQNIAGNALKTIDLTIGMENGTSEMGTTTTDYSFQFAKRFWGNRISVIVGGKVSTGADATNSAESFIDNVSVEYRLDKSATRYVRAFYDRGTQDPFEGQLTKTGAGLVLRRKTNKLGELFIFRTRKKEPAAGQ